MAALLTMIAIMSILLSAILPVWRHEMRRERESELVFRGEQYVHAIALFQRRFGSYPPSIDVLVQQKFLRKKYPDPITGKDFRPVFAGQVGQPQGSQPQTGGTRPPSASQTTSPTTGFQTGVGGLMGVASTSDENSIRIYKGRTKYNQWQFIYAGATLRPGGPGGVRQPGPVGPGGVRPGGPGGPMGPGGPGGGPSRPRGPGGPGEQQPPRGPGGRPPGFGSRPPGGY